MSVPNNLKITHPELAKEWCNLNSIDNPKLIPENFISGSGQYVYWKCRNYHIYGCTIHDRFRSSGCPYCSNKKPHSQNNILITHPELIKEWSSFNEIKPTDISRCSMKKIIWRCNNNHYYEASPNTRTYDHGCGYCWGRKSYSQTNLVNIAENYISEWSNLNSMEDGYHHLKPENFGKGSHQEIIWRCKYGHYSLGAIHDRLNDHGCGYCSGRNVCWDNCAENTHSKLIKEWNFDLNDGTLQNYVAGSRYRAHWICEFGHKWQTSISERAYHKTDCPNCAKSISSGETEWLDILDVPIRNNTIKIFRTSKVDGLSKDKKIVYEFHGDYWHGNPNIYNHNEVNKKNQKNI